MSVDIIQARQIISEIVLPEPLVEAQGDEASPFTAGTDQAAVIGQDVFAFLAGTDVELRDAIADSALLAQLVADSRVPDPDDIVGWYAAYFTMLKTLGWLVQDGGWSEVSEAGDGFEVHEKIAAIAAVLLGPAVTALAAITATLDALKAASDDSPWITLFNKRSIKGRSARFQIGVVDPQDGGAPLVSLIAFALEAKTVVTQVLLFKVTKNRAKLRTNSSKVSLDLAALHDLAPDVRAKLRGWQRAYIKALPDLELPPPPDA
ncbi:hypothetical protein [Novosphingobium sp. 9U]|uniref:hypothetical protein n=1 Tax=Novosphingobium sp. 9U TaxID=2653158 RepID=UPI0012F1E3C3|nr:hypothetical protein [Novosphingobium sp. 9U]VWX54514.1 hypothetical protein NOVOSPHI9U_630059 [Novosphingobium sp. 9U]